VATVLSPSERRQVVTGQKTLKDVISARKPSAPAAPAAAAPAATETAAAQPQEPAPATPAEPTPPPAPAPAPEGATPASPANPEDVPDRFRFKDPVDQTIALIAKTRGVSLLEAGKIYASENGGAKPAEPSAPAAPAEPAVDPGLTQYDKQLAELNDKLTKLSDERKKAREDVDMEKADSLSDEIAELKAERRILENERHGYVRNREHAVVQSFQQQVTASHDRVVTAYPELAAEGSLHRLALNAYVDQAFNDPQRAALFKDPSWPEKLGAEFAEKHGLKKKGAAAPAAATPPPASAPANPAPPATPAPTLRPKVQQVPGAKLVTGADGPQPSAPTKPTEADLRAALPRMNAAQRRELFRLRPAGKPA
jgi:hypothetical protein